MIPRIAKAPAQLVLIAAAGLLAGCESGSLSPGAALGPASAAETDTGPSLPTVAPPSATRIVMVLPGRTSELQRVWAQAARMEAGRLQAVLEVGRPAPDDPPGRQADLVRSLVKARASALIVLAEDPESIGPALAEARDRGVPVVLLVRPVAVAGPPLPLVTFAPFEAGARALVEAAIAEAKATGQSPEGPALLVVDPSADPAIAGRAQALEAALEQAGVARTQKVEFRSIAVSALAAQHAVEAAVAAQPEIAMVFADDDHGLAGAQGARTALGDKGEYVLVGFVSGPAFLSLVQTRDCAAVVNIDAIGIARRAVQQALKLTRNEPVPERTLVESQAVRSSGPRPKGGLDALIRGNRRRGP